MSLTKYTVKKGDTLWSIAKKFLGDGNKYKDIQKANGLKDTVIHAGTVLKIPSKSVDYSELGRAYEKALNDVDKLSSVQKLYEMIGE